jgi:small basic protein (TIGR04137 family)
MSLDRSLRRKSLLERHRNVLTRSERVASLIEQEKWEQSQSPFKLPKIAHRKAKAGRKAVAKTAEEAAAAAATPAGAAPAAPPAK